MNDGQNDCLGVDSVNMGWEVHSIMYQFNGNDYIDTTTFMNIKVIHHSTDDYSDFKIVLYLDADIDTAEDEHIGCDPDN